MFLFGVVLYLLIIGLTLLTGATISTYIDMISFLFVFGSIGATLIIVNGYSDFWYAIKVLTLKNQKVDTNQLSRSILLFKLLIRSTFGIGGLGFIIGLIMVVAKLTDPLSIGPSLAVAFLVVFYCLVLNLIVLMPGEYVLKSKYSDH